jgi:hypothetical protein
MKTHFVLHAADLGPDRTAARVLRGPRDRSRRRSSPALVGASPSTSEPARLLEAMRADVTASGRTPGTVSTSCARSLRRSTTTCASRHSHRVPLRRRRRHACRGATSSSWPRCSTAPTPTSTTVPHHRRVASRGSCRGHRREFDELLPMRAPCMDLRDDNGPYTVEWPLACSGSPCSRRAVGSRSPVRSPGRPRARTHPGRTHRTAPRHDADSRSQRGRRRAIDRARRSLLDAPELVGTPEPPPPRRHAPALRRNDSSESSPAVTDKLARGEHADRPPRHGHRHSPVHRRRATRRLPEAAIAQLETRRDTRGSVHHAPRTTSCSRSPEQLSRPKAARSPTPPSSLANSTFPRSSAPPAHSDLVNGAPPSPSTLERPDQRPGDRRNLSVR